MLQLVMLSQNEKGVLNRCRREIVTDAGCLNEDWRLFPLQKNWTFILQLSF